MASASGYGSSKLRRPWYERMFPYWLGGDDYGPSDWSKDTEKEFLLASELGSTIPDIAKRELQQEIGTSIPDIAKRELQQEIGTSIPDIAKRELQQEIGTSIPDIARREKELAREKADNIRDYYSGSVYDTDYYEDALKDSYTGSVYDSDLIEKGILAKEDEEDAKPEAKPEGLTPMQKYGAKLITDIFGEQEQPRQQNIPTSRITPGRTFNMASLLASKRPKRERYRNLGLLRRT